MPDDVRPDAQGNETTTTTTGAQAAPVSVSGATQAASPTPAPAGGAGATPATEAAASPQTLLSADGKDDKAVAAPADWPDDWRQKLAGEDKALLKQLDRLGSPADLFKSYRALQQKISSGELKAAGTPYPEKGTDEEKAAWRKENGVPDKAEDYKIEPPKGFVFGDADKPSLESFQKYAHALNWTPAQLNQAVAWYASEQEQIIARQQQEDGAFRQKAEDDLRSEWGNNYRQNINAVQNLLSSAPTGLSDRLLSARLADGRLLGDDPVALKWLAGLSREVNPVATLSPAVGDPSKTMTARKAELEALIKDRRSVYYRGNDAAKLQTEYRDILAAEERMKSRAA